MQKEEGYARGIAPGLALVEACQALGVEEVSIYGFTQDNTRRSSLQKRSFTDACVDFARQVVERDVALQVVGDDASAQFPQVLRPYVARQGEGMKVNLLVNYGWEWDLNGLKQGAWRSHAVSRIDLIVRWGGGRRLSGFLPVQSVYADMFVVDDYWPDFQPAHFEQALAWYAKQDRTLGG